MSPPDPAKPSFFVLSRGSRSRFGNLGWPLWKLALLCGGIGVGVAVFSAGMGLFISFLESFHR